MIAFETETTCENYEIAAYIDGDLSLSQELEIESHFEVCPACSKSLTEQKSLLCAMDFAFSSPDPAFELPKNFASTIVTTAESSVNGLRNAKERKRALSFCIILLTLGILGIGEGEMLFDDVLPRLFANILAVVTFAGHFAYDSASGIASIAGGISSRLFFFSDASTIGLIMIFVLVLLAFSRLLIRYHRA